MAGDVAKELAAMRRIANTIDALEGATRTRVLDWIRSRYDLYTDDTVEYRLSPTPGDLAHPNT